MARYFGEAMPKSVVLSTALALAMIAICGASVQAQFFTPLPNPVIGDSVRVDEYRRALVRTVLSNRHGLVNAAAIDAAIETICGSQGADEATCRDVLNHDTLAQRGKFKAVHISYLAWRWPLGHDAEEVRQYLKGAGDNGSLAVFSQFSANVSDNTAYVATDIVSGMIGRVLFGIQYASVVAKDTGESAGKRDTVEDGSASLLRMINSGGTVSARVVAPLYAASGTTAQSAASITGSAGMLGPVSNSDSLRFSTTLAATYMIAFPIRDSDAARTALGELLLGAHAGWGWSESRLVASEPGEVLGYWQLAVGFRRGSDNNLGLSVLYTGVSGGRGNFRQLVPRLIVNFVAFR